MGWTQKSGLPLRARLADQAHVIERRRLVGHQCRARDAAKVERGLICLEHAEVDQPRCNDEAGRIDYLRVRWNIHRATRENARAFDKERADALAHLARGRRAARQ
jgi:hypothetical protein